jgi:hypothetical protein
MYLIVGCDALEFLKQNYFHLTKHRNTITNNHFEILLHDALR